MRVLLIDPALRNGIPEMYENLGVAGLTAATRAAGFQTDMLFAHLEGWSRRRLGRELLRRNPDVLGVSLLADNARPTLEMLRRLRGEGLRSRIVLGGHFPTFNDLQLLRDWPQIDAIVRGEGEITLVELLEAWQQGTGLQGVAGLTWRQGEAVRSNPARALVPDLDSFPRPARDHTDRIVRMGGFLNMVRSRGCYANCSFCSIASFYRAQGGPAWRRRSLDDVLDEMAALARRWPGVELKFHDDQFIGPGKRGHREAMAFAQALLDRGLQVPFSIFARADTIEPELFRALQRAGLRSVFVGVESGSQRELDAFGKRLTVADNRRALQTLHDLDIGFHMGLIFFDPYTEWEDISANMDFINQTRPLWSKSGNVLSVENRVVIYRGTPFYDRLAAAGRLQGNYLDYRYGFPDPRVGFLCALSGVLLKKILPLSAVVRRLPTHLRRLRSEAADRFRTLIRRRVPAAGRA